MMVILWGYITINCISPSCYTILVVLNKQPYITSRLIHCYYFTITHLHLAFLRVNVVVICHHGQHFFSVCNKMSFIKFSLDIYAPVVVSGLKGI